MPKVALFVTCVADQVFPDTAESTVRVLEAAGAEVVFPPLQTCCGQPALTAGEPEAAQRLARHHLDVFDSTEFDAIVTPSGSCAAMVCHHYPDLVADRRTDADASAARTFELTQYVVDVLGVDDIGARLDSIVTVHDACHGLRNLGLGRQMRTLLAATGATLVEMTEPDTCCGFGGVFSFGFPEVSTRLADAKIGHAATTPADYMVSGDLACSDAPRGAPTQGWPTVRAPIDPHRGSARVRTAKTMSDGHAIATPGDDFHERTANAVANPVLQKALHNLDRRLRTASTSAAAHPDWKDRAAAIRRETLLDLDGWLDRLETTLTSRGVQVHRASTPDEARRVIVEVARARGARTVVKSKSMATEEIDLGHALEQAGMTSIETDLGEYIVQLAGERPSHMITPAIHKTLPQIRDILAREAGTDLAVDREELTLWARGRLRGEFLRAEVGITGVNFAAADTGTLVLVTNEGNGRFCTTVPRVHIAVMPVEKVIPRLADVGILLPLLTSDATGQALSNYVTMITGPAARGRGGRSRRAARRVSRQPAPDAARHEVRGDACVHPLRRVPQRVPRVSERERTRVRRGVLGSDGQGAHAASLRRRRGRRSALRLDAVSRVQRRVPGEDPARRHDPLAARRRAGCAHSSAPPAPGVLVGLGEGVVNAARIPAHAPLLVRAFVWPGPRLAGMDRDPRAPSSGPRCRSAIAGPRSTGDRDPARNTDRDPAREHLRGVGADGRRRRVRPQSSNASPETRSWPVTTTCRSPAWSTPWSRGIEILDPSDPEWSVRIAQADAGITGALLAVAQPAAIAPAAAPGAPRGRALSRPRNICVVRVADLIPTLADAMQTIATGELPSVRRGSEVRAVPVTSR